MAKSQVFSFKASFSLSALKDKDRKEVERRLSWFEKAKTVDFRRKVIVTKLAHPDRHLIRLSNRLYGVISRRRNGLRVHDIFNQDAALNCFRGLNL